MPFERGGAPSLPLEPPPPRVRHGLPGGGGSPYPLWGLGHSNAMTPKRLLSQLLDYRDTQSLS